MMGAGEERWPSLNIHHELYKFGHIYETDIAHYQASTKAVCSCGYKKVDLVKRSV